MAAGAPPAQRSRGLLRRAANPPQAESHRRDQGLRRKALSQARRTLTPSTPSHPPRPGAWGRARRAPGHRNSPLTAAHPALRAVPAGTRSPRRAVPRRGELRTTSPRMPCAAGRLLGDAAACRGRRVPPCLPWCPARSGAPEGCQSRPSRGAPRGMEGRVAERLRGALGPFGFEVYAFKVLTSRGARRDVNQSSGAGGMVAVPGARR